MSGSIRIGGEPRVQSYSATMPKRPPATAAVSAPSTSPDEPSFEKVLARLGNELQRVDTRLDGKVHSATSPMDLLAIQTGIYRATEVLAMTTKLIDTATNGVRSVLTKES